MKTIEIFCASPGSTAICSSMDHRSIIRHRMRKPLDRLGGDKPKKSAPCLSNLPFDPIKRSRTQIYRRKSSADVTDLSDRSSSFAELFSESRQLLIKNPDIDSYGNSKRLNNSRSFSTRSSYTTDEYPVYKPSSHAHQKSLSAPISRKVVELRVSIHCKGCEGKLRRYISRMEGVTSFTIDLATKKVTVVGDVNPAGVLTSISKVKNAQFWSSPVSSSSSSSSHSQDT